ncbi:hypothetical protein [Methylovirgula sp. HY1]|jgi:hypothetical protein|uniref:hypothetical protein n=1 Tax=Methylovirgula sp. HY1 TaxID=2822761 RepID=UPI001C5B50C5|nr:hypothetical protein [Methylovirgula sp. HY1]
MTHVQSGGSRFSDGGDEILPLTIDPPRLQRMQAAAKANPSVPRDKMAGGADEVVFTALFSHGKERHPAFSLSF